MRGEEVYKVALPSARSIGYAALEYCYDLRHITLHPDVEIESAFFQPAFLGCLSP